MHLSSEAGTDLSQRSSSDSAAPLRSAIDDWPTQLRSFTGARRLNRVRVYYDFVWHEVFGHKKRTFRNGDSLTRYIREDCPEVRKPALLLTIREGCIKSPIHHGNEWVVVVKVHDYLKTSDPDPARTFFARGAQGPINQISALQNFVYTTEQLDAALSAMLDGEALKRWAETDVSRLQVLVDLAKAAPGFGALTPVAAEPGGIATVLCDLQGLDEVDSASLRNFIDQLRKLSGDDAFFEVMFDDHLDERSVPTYVAGKPERYERLMKWVETARDDFRRGMTREEAVAILRQFSGKELSLIFNMVLATGEEKIRYFAENLDVVRRCAEHEITDADVVALGFRKSQLDIFEKLLRDSEFFEAKQAEWQKRGKEAVWQHFFEYNPWIFGYGLHYIFASPLDDQKLEQVVSGFQVDRAGKRVDALMKTNGMISALCFVEIKTHETALLQSTPYRAECWAASDELGGSIAQIQKTVHRACDSLREKVAFDDSHGNPTGEIAFLCQPRSCVVIGCLSEFCTDHGINSQKFTSFELFRHQLTSPQIITFDELYERAKCIVEHPGNPEPARRSPPGSSDGSSQATT